MKILIRKNPLFGLVLFILPGLLMGGVFSLVYNRLSTQQLQTFLLNFGYSAAIIFIVFFTLRTFFIFAPYYMMLVVGGTLFGSKLGLIYNFIAVFLSASLAFVLSKSVRKTVQKRFHFEKYASYVDLIERHGFKILVFMRIAIIFPFDLLNYAAGLTGMRYRKFITANIIGVIPEVIFLTCFGQSLRTPRSLQFIVFSIIFCVVVLLGYKYKHKLQKWIKSIQ